MFNADSDLGISIILDKDKFVYRLLVPSENKGEQVYMMLKNTIFKPDYEPEKKNVNKVVDKILDTEFLSV